jgi:uncharacterized protein (TIGR00106 family)
MNGLESFPGAGEVSMLLEFSVVPVGTGSSMGEFLANVMRLVDESGLPYKLNPMGTVVEGRWEDVMGLVRKCHDSVMEGAERAVTTIKIDDRKGKTNMLESKIRSVEERLGRELKK